MKRDFDDVGRCPECRSLNVEVINRCYDCQFGVLFIDAECNECGMQFTEAFSYRTTAVKKEEED